MTEVEKQAIEKFRTQLAQLFETRAQVAESLVPSEDLSEEKLIGVVAGFRRASELTLEFKFTG